MRADGHCDSSVGVGEGWGRERLSYERSGVVTLALLPLNPLLGKSRNEVQDDGGGERVWVSSITLGWDGAVFFSPARES